MTNPSDTLTLDPTLIARWRADGVDYTQEFATISNHAKEQTSTGINPDKWLNSMMPDNESSRMAGAVILCIIAAIVTIIILRKKFEAPALRVTLDPDEEDTIYGVDFVKALQTAEEEHNYVQCIRLRYLQLLRLLHDQQKICWLPGKTSTQYVNEVNLAPFSALTQTFVRVRYGKYPADEMLYAELNSQAQEVERLIEPENIRKETEA